MQKHYDVIVIGGGPAGLAASQEAAQSGLNVLVVEQKKDPASVYRSCCANLIIEPGTHSETVRCEDGRIVFESTGFSVPYSGRVIPLTSSVKISPGGKRLTVNGKSPEGYVALSIEKEALLKDMCSNAQSAGVEMLCETRATAARQDDGAVELTVTGKDGERTLTADIAIAADGVNSRIVDSLGLNEEKRTYFARFAVVSYLLEGVDCPHPSSWITFVGKGHTKGNRGQLYMCPKPFHGKTDPPLFELTCGVPSGGISPKQEADYFMSRSTASPWFADARIAETRSAVLNFYTPLIEPVQGRVVVAGDAAAFIETYIQGALMYGYSAGKAVAAHLTQGSGLERYAELWKKTFEYNDPEEIKQATQGFGLHVLDDEDLDYLFALTQGDDIRGFVNEFSDAATVRSAIMQHIDQIRSERPGLARRIETFSDVSVDDALQVSS